MSFTLTRQQVQELDRRATEEFGVPSLVLMENAGRTAAEILVQIGAPGPILICAGKGNNGGDGFVVARHLDLRNVPCRVLLFAQGDELSRDARVNFNIVERAGIPVKAYSSLDLPDFRKELASAGWIVDALFGTGLVGSIRPPFEQIISAINDSRRQVLAIDIPSGLDCDTGRPLGCAVRADHTVTFVARKKGFENETASAWLGEVHVASIGAPRQLVESYS
jgi:NAD(P)H-hydrate epimerase